MMTHQELMNEVDMLKGNINRICVTDNTEEMERMYRFAQDRLYNVYCQNKERLRNIHKPNPWIDVHDRFPEPYKRVEIKLDNGDIEKDMLIKGKYGNLEWRNYVDKYVKYWREI